MLPNEAAKSSQEAFNPVIPSTFKADKYDFLFRAAASKQALQAWAGKMKQFSGWLFSMFSLRWFLHWNSSNDSPSVWNFHPLSLAEKNLAQLETWLGEFEHPGALVSSSQGGALSMCQHCGTPVQLQLPGFGWLKCCVFSQVHLRQYCFCPSCACLEREFAIRHHEVKVGEREKKGKGSSLSAKLSPRETLTERKTL